MRAVRRVAVVAVLVLVAGAGLTTALLTRGDDAPSCPSAALGEEALDLPSGFGPGLADQDFTASDLRGATPSEVAWARAQLVARHWSASDLAGLGVCAISYSGTGHRVTNEQHRSGLRAPEVSDVDALLVWGRQRVDVERCYGPTGACPPDPPQKTVVCGDVLDARTGLTLGRSFCFDEA
jgi:hypothetical protein